MNYVAAKKRYARKPTLKNHAIKYNFIFTRRLRRGGAERPTKGAKRHAYLKHKV
jgi:hypothetical protein